MKTHRLICVACALLLLLCACSPSGSSDVSPDGDPSDSPSDGASSSPVPGEEDPSPSPSDEYDPDSLYGITLEYPENAFLTKEGSDSLAVTIKNEEGVNIVVVQLSLVTPVTMTHEELLQNLETQGTYFGAHLNGYANSRPINSEPITLAGLEMPALEFYGEISELPMRIKVALFIHDGALYQLYTAAEEENYLTRETEINDIWQSLSLPGGQES